MKKLLLVSILLTPSFTLFGNTAESTLEDACQKYNPLTVRQAILSGANVNQLNRSAQTPLLYVCSFEFYSKLAINYAEQLLRAGALVDCQDNEGNTALHIACKASNNNLVFLLLDYKADTKIKNNLGQTALHVAAQHIPTESVEFLLAFDADINATDNTGRTPLHIASEYGNKAIVECLLKNGAKSDVTDANGYTPIDLCCNLAPKNLEEDKLQILKLLKGN